MNKAPMSEAWPLLPSDEYDKKGVFSFLTCQLRLVSGVCWDQGWQRSGRDVAGAPAIIFCYFPLWFQWRRAKKPLHDALNIGKKVVYFLILVHQCVLMDLYLSARQGSLKREASGKAVLLLTTLKPKLVTTAPPPSWISGAGVMLSISVSECFHIPGRRCEMVEALGHGAGQSAHTGHGWSINRGPLVWSWSAGATTPPSIDGAALKGANVRGLRSLPPAVMASSPAESQPLQNHHAGSGAVTSRSVSHCVILTFTGLRWLWCQ